MQTPATKADNFLNTQINFRPATQADVNFIFNSWLKSNRHSNAATGVLNPVYFAQHHLLIEGLCKQSKVIMAVNAEDSSQIYGYSVTQEIEGAQVIHYIYVKEPYRRLGLAGMLLATVGINLQEPFFATHRTNVCKNFDNKYSLVYNPYLAFYAYELGKRDMRATRDELYTPAAVPTPVSRNK